MVTQYNQMLPNSYSMDLVSVFFMKYEELIFSLNILASELYCHSNKSICSTVSLLLCFIIVPEVFHQYYSVVSDCKLSVSLCVVVVIMIWLLVMWRVLQTKNIYGVNVQ